MPASGGLPAINTVTLGAPLRWLGRAWSDLWKAPFACLAYGLMLAIASACLVTWMFASGGALPAVIVTCGFVFIAPLLAMGFYEAGRLLSLNRKPTLGDLFFVRSAFRSDIAYLGLALVFIFFIWGEIARIVYGLSTYRLHRTAEELIAFATGTPEGHGMLISGSVIGAVIAYLTYCIVVVSIPMLLRRDSDFFVATVTSVRSVARNPGPMALWALIIAALTAVSIGTAFVGLIITFPVLGLASWHAYRDLVVSAPERDTCR